MNLYESIKKNLKENSLDSLTPEQREELKQRYYMEKHEDEGVSWGELANIDELVSDEEIEEEYGSTFFTNDDFFCTAGLEESSTNEPKWVMNADELDVIEKAGLTVKGLDVENDSNDLDLMGYTGNGVEMTITVSPTQDESLFKALSEYTYNFDANEEYENYKNDALFTDHFSEDEAVADFNSWLSTVDGIVKQLRAMERGTIKEADDKPRFVDELPAEELKVLRNALGRMLKREGYADEEYNDAIDRFLDSKILDIYDTIRYMEDTEATKIYKKYDPYFTEGDDHEDEDHKHEDIDSDDELTTVADHVEENLDEENDALEKYTDFISFVKEKKPDHADKIIDVLKEIIKDEEDHINKLVGIDNNDFDVKDQDEEKID